MVTRFFAALAWLAMAIAGAALCALVGVLAWQVFGRYALNDSPGWTEPMAITLMSVAALMGAAVAVRSEAHFAFPTLVELSPKPLRLALKTLARAISLLFGAALAIWGFYLMADGWEVPMAGAPMPEGMAFVGLCVGGVFIALFALERMLYGDPPPARHDAGDATATPAEGQ